MDGYLRLILLVVAAVIVAFILFESWYRHRQKKLAHSLNANLSMMDLNPDNVLGLNHKEPVLNLPIESTQTGNNENLTSKPNQQKPYTHLNDLLIITVVAPADAPFVSYDLLQAISATGLQFGEGNIFHYLKDNQTVFSLSSVNEPGDFNLDRIGDLSCDGLTLFTDLNQVENPEQAFQLMLNAAEQLAEDLNGELRAGTRKPWNEEVYQLYYQKALMYQQEKHAYA